ncbi:hypothetical protein [Mesorhizobium mediterraneum]
MNETSPMGLSSTGLAQSAISARGLVKTFGKLAPSMVSIWMCRAA